MVTVQQQLPRWFRVRVRVPLLLVTWLLHMKRASGFQTHSPLLRRETIPVRLTHHLNANGAHGAHGARRSPGSVNQQQTIRAAAAAAESHYTDNDDDNKLELIDQSDDLIYEEGEEEDHRMLVPSSRRTNAPSFQRDAKWLETATTKFLESFAANKASKHHHHHHTCDDGGQYDYYLTMDDVNEIKGLMSAWAKRKSPLMVEQLLKLIIDDMRAGNRDIAVSTRFYAIAMDAWAKSGVDGSAERAQAIHDNMIRMYRDTGDDNIAPSVVSYNNLVSAWARQQQHQDGLQQAECVLKEMLSTDCNVQPDATTFVHLLNGYGNALPEPNITRALELVNMMDDLGIEKTYYVYGALQNVYASSQRADAPQKSKALLDEMLDSYNGSKEQELLLRLKPTIINFNLVLKACARVPSMEAAVMAKELLQRMRKPRDEGGYDIEPDRVSYTSGIHACIQSPENPKLGVEMAQQLLQQMEEHALSERQQQKDTQGMAPPRVVLTCDLYNVVLNALSNVSVERALSLVRHMECLAERYEDLEKVRPTRRSYNFIMNAMVRSTTSKTQTAESMAETATALLRNMWRMDAAGNDKTFPMVDSYTYTAILILHQRSTGADAPEKVDRLIREMEQLHEDGLLEYAPDVVHYTIAISTWARRRSTDQSRLKETVHRCSQILLHMMDRHKAGFANCVPNYRTYNAFIDALSRAREEEKAEKVLYYMLDQFRQGNKEMAPDSFSFNSVMIAFCKSRQKGSGQRAESILNRLIQYSEEENPDVDPNERSFGILINYYCRAIKKIPDALYRAEFILNQMVDYCRNKGACVQGVSAHPFLMVIEAYGEKRMPDGGERAERLLRVMNELRTALKDSCSRIRIDSALLQCVMLAWANSRDDLAAQKAEYHLDAMERRFVDGDQSMRPTTQCYSIVLKAWTTSRLEGAARRALDVLRRMEVQITSGKNNDVAFDPFVKSLVIKACIFANHSTKEESEAYQIATMIFEEMTKEDKKTLSITYAWFLHVCGRLGIPEDEKHAQIERAFLKCCEEGLVNENVLSQTRVAAPLHLCEKLLSPAMGEERSVWKLQPSDLPMHWRRNVSNRRNEKSNQATFPRIESETT